MSYLSCIKHRRDISQAIIKRAPRAAEGGEPLRLPIILWAKN